MRLVIYTLALLVLMVPLYVGLGRAIDMQVRYQERVITTKHGRTLDCRVDRYEDGSIYLNDCNYVQVP